MGVSGSIIAGMAMKISPVNQMYLSCRWVTFGVINNQSYPCRGHVLLVEMRE